ncbi:hypothetical protein [Nonomuraea sp. B5E05]|uniref:hypothetical protein n=1 Tax=Nonomuraea sp. B5E05 TaxID=3153569 RepID=UPI003260FE19
MLRRINEESFDSSSKNPDVTAAFRKWSVCMRRDGFSYTDPLQATNDSRWSSDQPTPDEISTAVADVKCKEEVHLVQVWARTERSFQTDELKKHGDRFERLRARTSR